MQPDEEGLLFLKNPNSIAITEKLANRHGLKKGDKITLIVGSKKVIFTITNLLKMEGPAKSLEGNFGLIDIASAQEALEKVGLIDRIDLMVDQSQPIEAIERELKKVIPPGVEVRRSDTRSGQIEKMVSAFHLNLTALSFISFVVGMFLIYNAISISVIQRRREIGILRSLGLTRSQVLSLFIGEAAWIGCLGSLVGIGIGIGLAKVMLYLVSRTITALYILVKAEHLLLSPSILIAGFGMGVLASVLSSIGPAREASRIAPKEALALGTLETKIKIRLDLFQSHRHWFSHPFVYLCPPEAHRSPALLRLPGCASHPHRSLLSHPFHHHSPQPPPRSASPFPVRIRRKTGEPIHP